jgi:hypothetical protein
MPLNEPDHHLCRWVSLDAPLTLNLGTMKERVHHDCSLMSYTYVFAATATRSLPPRMCLFQRQIY